MRILLRAGVVVGAVIMLTGAGSLDPGEIHCEEAVKHLADCCGQPIDAIYDCTAGRGCDSRSPDLDDPKATEVRDTSCEELIASGACQKPPMTPQPSTPGWNWYPDMASTDLAHRPDLAGPDLAGPDLAGRDLMSVDGGDM